MAANLGIDSFKEGQLVVYPAHGVGRITGVEEQQVAGVDFKCFVVFFEKDKLLLRIPVNRAKNSGLRNLCTKEQMETAIKALKTPSRPKRMMWSRRAQEYETKINSGDPISIAKVVRDLYRSSTQPEQSYSERQIYQAALERLIREYAAVEQVDETSALQQLEEVLAAA